MSDDLNIDEAKKAMKELQETTPSAIGCRARYAFRREANQGVPFLGNN
jgi:hypothetical protein